MYFSPREGKYRLAYQSGTTARFAFVHLHVAIQHIDEVTVGELVPSGWSSALRAGVIEGLAQLCLNHVLPPVRIELVDFIGLTAYTTNDAVFYAALVAVCCAVLNSNTTPRLEFDEHSDS